MPKIKPVTFSDFEWKDLYRAGGIAALIAGILFRRNLGVEIALFSPQKQPGTVADWFALLQTNRLLGLAYLHIFDLVNYALLGVMFLALYALLRRTYPSAMAIAAACAFSGIAVFFATNTAFSMLALSEQYAAAASEAQRNTLLSAGEALLVINRFSSPGAHPGTGGYLNLFLVAAASVIASLVMLRSGMFGRAAAYIGILAGALDLAYCTAYASLPGVDGELLAALFIPAAGLLWMVWHILAGWRLYQFGRARAKAPARQA